MYKSKILKTRQLNCNIIYYFIINLKIFAHLYVYYSQHPSQKVFAAEKRNCEKLIFYFNFREINAQHILLKQSVMFPPSWRLQGSAMQICSMVFLIDVRLLKFQDLQKNMIIIINAEKKFSLPIVTNSIYLKQIGRFLHIHVFTMN